jgi:hypothetical protein
MQQIVQAIPEIDIWQSCIAILQTGLFKIKSISTWNILYVRGNLQSLQSENCHGSCHLETGICIYGCSNGWLNQYCNDCKLPRTYNIFHVEIDFILNKPVCNIAMQLCHISISGMAWTICCINICIYVLHFTIWLKFDA